MLLNCCLCLPCRNNKDFRDVSLLDEDGKVLLHFAAAYGFRSIQNLVQKMKRGKCTYHYVEVMACPSGCLNGGGQVIYKVAHFMPKLRSTWVCEKVDRAVISLNSAEECVNTFVCSDAGRKSVFRKIRTSNQNHLPSSKKVARNRQNVNALKKITSSSQ